MLITKEIFVDTCHRVPSHKGKCRNIHGHCYRVEVGVDDKLITEGSSEGMVIDFSDLKEIMMREIDERLDHNSIFSEEDPDRAFLLKIEERQVKRGGKSFEWVDFVPTVENICRYFFDLMEPALEKKGIKIAHVKIWETRTSSAIYKRTDKYV